MKLKENKFTSLLSKHWQLVAILVVSFIAKIGARIFLAWNENYWESGYSHYYEIAQNLLKEGEISLGGHKAYRVPGYPIFIATVLNFVGSSAFLFIIIQALISTITVAIVYTISARIFGKRSAILAATLCAFYPYSFIHDTALQENGLYNCLSLASVFCLMTVVEKKRVYPFFFVGLLLGLTTLVRSSHLLHSFFITVFLFITFRKDWKRAFVFTGTLVIAFFLCLSPWLIRNKNVVGSWTLSSEEGLYLATAHNEFTFDFFPYRASIDEAKHYFLSNLSDEAKVELNALTGDEMAQSRWFQSYAIRYVLSHKLQTALRGFYKAAVNFLGILSPLQDPLKNTIYFLSYWALTLLAIKSLPVMYKHFYFQIFMALCLSQAAFSFIFWAHSSHRSFLDPLLAVLAGIGLDRWLNKKEEKPSLLHSPKA